MALFLFLLLFSHMLCSLCYAGEINVSYIGVPVETELYMRM